MVGNNIAKFRKLRGLTQAQLAVALNVTQSAVSQWETNKTLPDVQQLFAVAKYFGVSTEELQGIEIQKNLEKITQDDVESRFLVRDGEHLSPERRKKAEELLRKLMEMDDDELDQAGRVIDIYHGRK